MTAPRPHLPPHRPGFSLIELLVAIAALVVLAGLTMAAVQRVRTAAARTDCQNRLRQIGLALHQYHDAKGRLPPGCSYLGGKDRQPFMSWMTRLLPYVEQQALWDEAVAAYEQNSFFETIPHRPILGRPQSLYVCPADVRAAGVKDYGSFQAAFTSYLGISGTTSGKCDGVLYLDSTTRFGDVTDGLSNTLAIGERPPSLGGEFGWWYAGWGQDKDGSADSVLGVRELKTTLSYPACAPGPYAFEQTGTLSECDFLQFWSFHQGGANFFFADGSVRFLRYNANPIMPALATRAGGEAATVPD